VTPLVEPVETPVVELVETPVESKAAETAAAETCRTEEKAGSGNVLIGYGTPGGTATVRRTRPRRAQSLVEHVEPRTPLVEPVETKRAPKPSSPLQQMISFFSAPESPAN
jgi:2-oxoisovalerate dehydrogenase E2 component (dihydrolipoyl transacylase)